MSLAPILKLLSGCILVCCVSFSFASPVYVAVDDVNLHQYQNSTSTVLLRIPKGAKVKVMDSSYGSWWQVRYRERIGFTRSTQLKYSKENDHLDYDPIVNASNLYNSRPTEVLPSRLPLFEHPATSSAVITHLPSGTKVKIVDENSPAWSMVHVQGRTGYLQKTKLHARPTRTPSSSPKPEVMADSGSSAGATHTLTKATSLRKAPDGQAKVLLRFSPGDQVKIIDDSGEWWWKAVFNGKEGWVKRRLLEKN